ncbi:MAG: hypothetical protein JF614_12100 [Acidobacteria bacterium]|nr:hypothetical protein [Acidobacteriota bacterium]
MKTIKTDVFVAQDGRVRIDLKVRIKRPLVDFPVHDLGPWPEDLSLRRADLYGEDER